MSEPIYNPIGTNLQISTDGAFYNIINNDDGTYRVKQHFNYGDLPFWQVLYARVQHVLEEHGTSSWSPSVRFKIITPTDILGICLEPTATSGRFFWIDMFGNKIDTIDPLTHPTFSKIKMVTTDIDRDPVLLTAFPKFWVKTTTSGPTGTFSEGKKCWWISHQPAEGFHVYPAFKRTTGVDSGGKYLTSDWCYIGTHLAHELEIQKEVIDDSSELRIVTGSQIVGDTEKPTTPTTVIKNFKILGSATGKVVSTGHDLVSFREFIANRNDASLGETGYREFDIWDMGLLRLLSLIAKASGDVQNAWGKGAKDTLPATGSTKARLVFKGTQDEPVIYIDDLWECYPYYVDKCVTNNMVLTLRSPMDNSTIDFSSLTENKYTVCRQSGWISDVMDGEFTIGNETHDLMELFLPKTVHTETESSFHDYLFTSTENDRILLGGTGQSFYENNNDSGLYCHDFERNATYTQAAMRIAKN